MPANPLRTDPSRTLTLRRGAIAGMARRFNALAADIRQLVVAEDEFGLVQNAQAWRFLSDDLKIAEYQKWLKQQVDKRIFEQTGGFKTRPWTAVFIESAYARGVRRSYGDVLPPSLARSPNFYAGSKDQALRSIFNQPTTAKQLQLLYTRTFDQLEGVTAAMAGKMSRILAAGLAHGKSRNEIAQQLAHEVGLALPRAQLIANTEIIYAHAEGQLDAMEWLGISETVATVEWTTAADPCPRCAAVAGNVYTIDEARGLIPMHPNCRCAWAPVVPDILRKNNPALFGIV